MNAASDNNTAPPRRMARLALLSLGTALVLVAIGLVLRQWFPFGGGLVLAFGEAALVGGLADWFAVRALFEHPLGIPFPHTAIIPHNRVPHRQEDQRDGAERMAAAVTGDGQGGGV